MVSNNSPNGGEDRGVSPVIGVILMVAITVILAAVIAAFVLDLGQSQGANAQAGVSFSEEGDVVTVSVNSVSRADDLKIDGTGDCSNLNNAALGTGAGVSKSVDLAASNSTTSEDYGCGSGSSDGTIQVIGHYDGNTNLIQERDL